MSIIKEAKKGNEQAFIKLMEEYKIPMYKTAKSILKNEDDVCDALQEALISIYNNLGTLKNNQYLKTWIIRITINKCYDLIAKNSVNAKKVVKFEQNFIDKENNIEENITEKTDLEKALEIIDNDLKTVMILYYYDDLSITDIADVLGIPKGTVKSKLSRARERLLKELAPQGGEL